MKRVGTSFGKALLMLLIQLKASSDTSGRCINSITSRFFRFSRLADFVSRYSCSATRMGMHLLQPEQTGRKKYLPK